MSKPIKTLLQGFLLPPILPAHKRGTTLLNATIENASTERCITIDGFEDILHVDFKRIIPNYESIVDTSDCVIHDDCIDYDESESDADYEYPDEKPHNYTSYTFSISTLGSSIYSQLITAVFHESEVPTCDFEAELLIGKSVTVVVDDERYCIDVLPLQA
jgi:hypothetical protein